MRHQGAIPLSGSDGRGEIPGPRGWPAVGVLPRLRRDPLRTFERAWRDYGDLVRLPVGPERVHVLNHPDLIRHVLQDNSGNYRKTRFQELLKPLLGEGLVTSNGEHWARQRRMVQPAFNRRRLDGLDGVIVGATAAMLDGWSGGADRGAGAVDVAREMGRLALEIVARALFGGAGLGGGGAAAGIGEAVSVAQDHITRRFWAFTELSGRLPTPRNVRFRRALRELDGAVRRLVEEYRRRDDGRRDEGLLSVLLAARDPATGRGMDGEQLRDEVMTLFIAGHETTANALAWTWHLLALHPEAEARLQAEVAGVLEGGRAPAAGDIGRLAYTRMVVQEAMRLYPPVWLFSRAAIADDELGGHAIPAGSIAAVCPYTLHRHPGFWEEPDAFVPERFAPERSVGRPRHAYLPFGAGPRACVGSQLAMMEMLLIVAMVVQRFRLRPAPGRRPIEPDPLVTLRPRGGLWMTPEPRAPAAAPA